MRMAILVLWAASLAVARPKVAFINAQQVILESGDGRAAARSLEEKFRESIQRLDARQTDKKTLEYRRVREDLQQQIEDERKRIVQELGKKLQSVLAKYAERKHYEAVLDVSDSNAPVVWFKKANDITKQVVAEYDRAYPHTAPQP